MSEKRPGLVETEDQVNIGLQPGGAIDKIISFIVAAPIGAWHATSGQQIIVGRTGDVIECLAPHGAVGVEVVESDHEK